jgi:hypothetical protein
VLDGVLRLHERPRSVTEEILHLELGNPDVTLLIVVWHAAPEYLFYRFGTLVPYFEVDASNCKRELVWRLEGSGGGGFGDPNRVEICYGKSPALVH